MADPVDDKRRVKRMGIRTGEDMDVISRSSNGVVSHVADGRVRVHGKLFARGGERMRFRG